MIGASDIIHITTNSGKKQQQKPAAPIRIVMITITIRPGILCTA